MYEYKLVDQVKGESAQVIEQLNAYGAAGWEILGPQVDDTRRFQNVETCVFSDGTVGARAYKAVLLRRVTGHVKVR